MSSTYNRRRGTAIIDTKKGIMVVSHGRGYLLPGGGARPKEIQIECAIRELREETDLYPIEIKYLFRFMKAKVFLMKVRGTPIPKNEIKSIAYYKPGCNIKVSSNTKKIIEKYYVLKSGQL